MRILFLRHHAVSASTTRKRLLFARLTLLEISRVARKSDLSAEARRAKAEAASGDLDRSRISLRYADYKASSPRRVLLK